MSASDELFLLIRSLNPTEKGYFKKNCKKHSDTLNQNYLTLFDAISKQKEYNEQKLKPLTPQLSVAKNYLFQLLTDSLVQYHSSHIYEIEIQNNLSKIQLLAERTLYESAYKITLKTKQLAIEIESFAHILQLLDWEVFLWQHVERPRPIYEVFEEKQDAVNKMQEIDYYRHQMIMLYEQYHSVGVRTDLALPQNFTVKTIENPEQKIGSVMGCLYYYGVLEYVANVEGDLETSYFSQRKIIDNFERNKYLLEKHTAWYISTLSNAALVEIYKEDYEKAAQSIQKLKTLTPKSVKNQTAHFVCYFNAQFEFLLHQAKYIEACDLAKEIKELLPNYADKIGKAYLIQLRFYAGCALVYAQQYKEALSWVNDIINDDDKHNRQDIQAVVRLLQLVIHYELNNHDWLLYSIPSLYRYLKDRNRLYEFEKAMLQFLKKLMKQEDTQVQTHFKQLKTQLEKVTENEQERQLLNYFDFIQWLSGKISS